MTLAISIAICHSTSAGYLYRDFLTGFAGISEYADSLSGCVIIENGSGERVIETTKFATKGQKFTYQVRLQAAGAKRHSRFLNRQEQYCFGAVWNYRDTGNYEGITISTGNTDYYDDITNRRTFKATTFKVTGGKEQTVTETETETSDGDEGSYITLRLRYDGRSLTIEAGNHKPEKIAEYGSGSFGDSTRIGYFAGKNSKITVKRLQYESEPIKEQLYATSYTKSRLDSAFRNSKDPLEGYWKYLDRKMDENKMRLGGKYTIAVVKHESSYRILYVDGAITKPGLWKPYMIKGTMKETPFIDNYELEWIDSEKETIADEGYATLSGNILSISLPINGTTVRFYKLQ